MKPRKITVTDMWHMDVIGPSCVDFSFGLTFQGANKNGTAFEITVNFPPYWLGLMGEHLHKVLQKQEGFLQQSRRELEGKVR